MTLTTERLREIAEDGFLEHGDAKLMARELLADREAQPAMWVMSDDLTDEKIISTPAYPNRVEAEERTIGELTPLYTAPPAPAVPEAISTRQAIANMERHELCGSINVAYKHGWNDFRAAILAQPVSQGCKLPDNVREALTLALQAMEFMGDTLNNIDAVCTEDVEYVTPAFTAVRGLLEAAPEVTVPTTKINCWSCKKSMTTLQLMSSDGICPHCNAEIDTEDDDE
uniref:Eaa1 n=1 Tax=Serratia marcescens TaxID=615 RepID=A0A1C3H9H7_SERMA|nr:Uncharacterised protein [Serratia marcescens]